PIDTLFARRQSAHDVAAADDDGELTAERVDFFDLLREVADDLEVDRQPLLSGQGFAGKLQEHASITKSGGVRKGSGLWTVGHQRDSSRSRGFAQLESHEPTHLDVLAELGHRLRDQLAHGSLRITDERLL